MTSPLSIQFFSEAAIKVGADLLAIPVFEGESRNAVVDALDRKLRGLIAAVRKEERFKGGADEQLLVHTHGRVGPARVLLLGAGASKDFTLSALTHIAARATRQGSRLGLGSVAISLGGVPGLPEGATAAVASAATGAELGRYQFDRYMTGERKKPDRLKKLVFVGAPQSPDLKSAAKRGQRIAQAVGEVRDLVNEPAITCTPTRLAEHAKEQAKDRGIECKVMGSAECKKLGLHLYLAVASGSDNEPRFIHLTYRPKAATEPKKSLRRIVLIGKGITFDSGGLSLKPAQSMEEMKTDMAGAATVLAAITAAADLGCPYEVHALVAAAENMPSGKSYRPGDVFVGLGGKSIEVNNTDAEGRLTLADALAYAVSLKPDEMIDVATLTGACMVALGPHMAGLMSNHESLAERLLDAAKRSGESMWRLPLPDRLREQLKSDVADMKNTGERWGGALTAGLFLKEFVDGKPWAHLDIAGPARADKEWGAIAKGGTGFGTATLIEHLLSEG